MPDGGVAIRRKMHCSSASGGRPACPVKCVAYFTGVYLQFFKIRIHSLNNPCNSVILRGFIYQL